MKQTFLINILEKLKIKRNKVKFLKKSKNFNILYTIFTFQDLFHDGKDRINIFNILDSKLVCI